MWIQPLGGDPVTSAWNFEWKSKFDLEVTLAEAPIFNWFWSLLGSPASVQVLCFSHLRFLSWRFSKWSRFQSKKYVLKASKIPHSKTVRKIAPKFFLYQKDSISSQISCEIEFPSKQLHCEISILRKEKCAKNNVWSEKAICVHITYTAKRQSHWPHSPIFFKWTKFNPISLKIWRWTLHWRFQGKFFFLAQKSGPKPEFWWGRQSTDFPALSDDFSQSSEPI